MNEAALVGAGVDGEEGVLRLIEAVDAVELRCFQQAALGVVAPAVVLAAKDERRASDLSGDGVRAVPADVVESARDVVFAQDDEDGEGCQFHGGVVARLDEAAAMRDADP